MSKKKGSSVSPAKNVTPVAPSVKIVAGFGVSASVGTVVGALKVSPKGIMTVAVCGAVVEVRGEKRMSMNWSARASPVVSSPHR